VMKGVEKDRDVYSRNGDELCHCMEFKVNNASFSVYSIRTVCVCNLPRFTFPNKYSV